MRWTFESYLDLGDLGFRNAIIRGDVKVTWAREPEDGGDEISINIVSVEIFVPGFDKALNRWNEESALVDVSTIFLSPKGRVLKQRMETALEDEQYREIMDAFSTRHIPDRNEDAI